MSAKVSLTMKQNLPLLLRAVRERKLQCYKVNSRTPRYSGPCAIGACLTRAKRRRLDEKHRAVSVGILATMERPQLAVPPEELGDWQLLQATHDRAVRPGLRGVRTMAVQRFERELARVAEKYGVSE